MRKRKGLQSVKISFVLFFILICTVNYSFSATSADTNAYKYFYLRIGYTYVYSVTDSSRFGVTHSHVQAKITKDTIIEGKKYFYLTNFPEFVNGGNFWGFRINGWSRMDSLSGNFYIFDASGSCNNMQNEKLIDSMAANIRDTINSCGTPFYSERYLCKDTSSVYIFSQFRNTKIFDYSQGLPGRTITCYRKFIKNIGCSGFDFYQYTSSSGISLFRYSLQGCVLGGIVYGDTNMSSVGMSNSNISLAHKFTLKQNYPNPFNPVTNITFEIPKNSFVKLKIYDVSGKELGMLINETLSADSYTHQWDAHNLTSGIYFYRLEADNFIETKKMVLLK